jgi:hypothetical protein
MALSKKAVVFIGAKYIDARSAVTVESIQVFKESEDGVI